jgi:hypothetical protein
MADADPEPRLVNRLAESRSPYVSAPDLPLKS